jgi:hypothetical protein
MPFKSPICPEGFEESPFVPAAWQFEDVWLGYRLSRKISGIGLSIFGFAAEPSAILRVAVRLHPNIASPGESVILAARLSQG